MFSIEPIGYVRTCFPEKFGIPRQPLLAPSALGVLVLEPPYNHPDAVIGLEGVSHLWLTFVFHQHLNVQWKPKVRPPRLGGQKTLGVFATRSSFRPNNLGLSVVKLEKIELLNQQVKLHVSGVDLIDGTPIVDIKPYLPYADNIPQAVHAAADSAPQLIEVTFSEQAVLFCSGYKAVPDWNVNCLRQLIVEVLQQDPRPAYKIKNDHQMYKMSLLDLTIEWQFMHRSNKGLISVLSVKERVLNDARY